MSLDFDGTAIIGLNNAFPGDSKEIKFTITNTGTLKAAYSLTMMDVYNDFADKNDLVYSITSTNNGGSISETISPSENTTLIPTVFIEPNVTQEYTLVLHFKETADDQNDNQNKKFSGRIQISTSEVYYLPSEYQQVQYIESTGTQYINTNFIPNQDTSIKIKASITKPYISALFCARNQSDVNSFTLFVIGNSVRYDYNIMGGGTSITQNVVYDFYANKNKLYIDGEIAYTAVSATFTNNTNLYLFASYKNDYIIDEGNYAYAKVYNIEIYDDTTKALHLIPAFRKSDSKPGLYDIINNEFYVNNGTGEFNVGPTI